MKIKHYLLLLTILLAVLSVTGQTMVPFSPRLPSGSIRIKGDIVHVGNSILGRTTISPTFNATGQVTNLAALTAQANASYTGGGNNNSQNFEYVNIDPDGGNNFSSSTADLSIVSSCKKIVFAGLYWTATYPYDRTRNSSNYEEGNPTSTPRFSDFNEVKLKVPGGTYINLIADNAPDIPGQEDNIIFDGYNFYPGGNTALLPEVTKSFKGGTYACYKNVTGLLQSLPDANGTYTLANMRASKGARNNGSCGGWTIVVIYESNDLPSKYISVFDGLAGIESGGGPVDFFISGFETLPAPLPVKAKIGVVTLEGDLGLTNDSFFIKANSLPPATPFTAISNSLNPINNFFNSTITNNNTAVLNRNPASTNTLGFDSDIVNIINNANAVIPNGETGATLRVSTTGDSYVTCLTSFAVDIIEPKIVLTKTVQDIAGNDAAGQPVTLCQPLNYTIGFQNIGNDGATNFTIRDVLPPNVSFNPASVVLPTPPVGCPPITFVYTAGTRTIIFNIPPCFVPKNGSRYVITLGVQVLCTCLELDDACSNLITNQAFSTYQGVDNATVITDDPSLSSYSACNVSPPSPTNTLVGLDDCNFSQNVNFCGTLVTLTAAPGYQTYTWSGPAGATITPVAGTNNQSVTVNQLGTYTVNNLILTAPCKSITQTINVVDLSGALSFTNPAIPVADVIRNCPSNNVNPQLPEIFLCGANDSTSITTLLTGVTSISWERLNVGSCAPEPNPNCPNTSATCTWTVVDGDNDNLFVVNAPGQYRVVYQFPGGCPPRIFYFNVYQDPFNPTITPRDAVCTSPGRITLSAIPAGYEYQLNCTGTFSPITSNPFSINVAAGIYSLCIRQIGVPGGCVFTYNNIGVQQRNFTTDQFITQPLCSTDKGSIRIDAIGVYPQYTYTVNQGATLIAQYGPTNEASTPTTPTNPFGSLSPGSYTYTVTTTDGCTLTVPFTINQPPAITLTAGITKPLSCVPPGGEFTIYPVGGTIVPPATAPSYGYNVTGPAGFVALTAISNPVISVTLPGTYNITAYDGNNCSATTSITISAVPPPVFTTSGTNVLCYGANTGSLSFNVTNINGHSLLYSYDNGVTFGPNATLSNQAAGTYQLVLQYTFGTGANASVCTSAPQTVTINQPFAALTASAGVSELAGCGPLGEGKVRITNPQGGVGPYTYSFDNQVTYTAINEAFLQCGTYTVYIKDFNNCIFAMPVTLDCAPTPPTIVVTPPVFACTGNATSTVTVNNNGGNFAYQYFLDGVLNTNPPPNDGTFTDVPCGPHIVRVDYKAINIPTPSNLLFEDFGIGANTTTPGIASAYCWNYQPLSPIPPVICPRPGNPTYATYLLEDNQYVVTRGLNPNNGNWFPFRDHTSLSPGPINPNGRFLAVNIGAAAGNNGILYSKTITDILPNQDIFVEAYVANLLLATANASFVDPSFFIRISYTWWSCYCQSNIS
jgi:large repetitive protein